ncbi:prepilin peptidase [Candidatus Poribacteria bacterium]|nr:prepilin peptidase [Candidatus Poribacteria bacterium]
MMLSYQNLSIVLLLLFCLHATYTDLRERKIKNFCSYGAVYAGILCHVISVLSGNSPLLGSIAILLGGFCIVLALYWFGIFAAGDAKLVWGASLLMPVGLFAEANAFAQYTPIALIINMFAPYFLILVAYLFIKTRLQQKLQAFTLIFQQEDFRKQIFEMVFRLIFLLGLGQFVTLSLGGLGIELGFWHQLLIVLSLYFTLSHYITKYSLEKFRNSVGSVVLIALMIVTTPWSLSAWSAAYIPFLKIYLVYIVIFFFGRNFIYNLDSMVLGREIDISDLREGMVPAEQIVKTEGDDGEVTYSKEGFALPNVLNSNIILGTLPGGVSKEKAAELKQLSEEGEFEDFENKIRIQRSLRFAPVIFLGVILTILCRGPFFTCFQ